MNEVFSGVLNFVGVFDDENVFYGIVNYYFIDDCVYECGFV